MSDQASFARAVLDPQLPCPPGLHAWNGSDPAARLAVYRNNVFNSLIDALADTFPVVQQLVGEDFFRAMAQVFVQTSPPASPLLAGYGEGFAGFVEGFAPARELPYLADVARLEFLRLRALHAADASVATADAWSAALGDPDALPGLRVEPHPSLFILRARHAAVSIWAAHQGLMALETVDVSQAEDALVLRPGDEVNVLELPPGGACLAQGLTQGESLSEAAERAVQEAPAFDLAPVLSILIRHGAFSAVHVTRSTLS